MQRQFVHPIQGHDGQELYVVLSAQCTPTVFFDRNAYCIGEFIQNIEDISPFSEDLADDSFIRIFGGYSLLNNHHLPSDIAYCILWKMKGLGLLDESTARNVSRNPVFKDYILKEFRLGEYNPVFDRFVVLSQEYFAQRAMEIINDTETLLRVVHPNAIVELFMYASQNPGIAFTPELIERFEKQWSWTCLINNPAAFKCFTLEFVKRYEGKHFRRDDVVKSRLMANPELIQCYMKDREEIRKVCSNKHSAITLDMLRRCPCLDWDALSENKGIVFTMEMLTEFRTKWNWSKLVDNEVVAALLVQTSEENLITNDLKELISIRMLNKRKREDTKYIITKTKIQYAECVISHSADGTNPVASCKVPDTIIIGDRNVMQISAIADFVDEYLEKGLPEDTRCAICLRQTTAKNISLTMNCFHVFHKECIAKVTNKKCPTCRQHFDNAISWETAHAFLKRKHALEKIESVFSNSVQK